MKDTLIVYGTRYGATQKTAELVAEVLAECCREGIEVRNVRDIKGDDFSLDGVKNLVLGSSVAAGRWTRAMRRFLSRADLSRLRVAIFVSAAGILEEKKEEIGIAERRARAVELFVDPIVNELGIVPVSKAGFGGHFRFFGKTVFDNWDGAMVQGWAHELAREFYER